MRNSLFIFITCVIIGATASVKAQENLFKTTKDMRNIRSCFSGDTADYAGFVEKERQSFQRLFKQEFSTEFISKFRPESQFNLFKKYYNCVQYEYLVGDLWVEGFLLSHKQNTLINNATIIYNRGGNGSYGALTIGSFMHKQAPLVRRGFVMLSSQYRENDEFGGKDLLDVLKLIEINKQIKNVNPEKLGMYGWSRGGMMTYMAARNNPAIKAIVVGAGVVDQEKELKWRPEMEQVYKYRIPHYVTEKKKALKKRSVINWLDELPRGMPILLLHGGADKRVNVENARDLAAELTKLKHPHELKIYPKGDHSLRKNSRDVNSRIIAWFTKYLNNP